MKFSPPCRRRAEAAPAVNRKGVLVSPDDPVIDAIDQDGEAAETALARRRPDTPTTLDELAAVGDAIKMIDRRVQIIRTLRLASLKETHPEDWITYKARDGGETAYLQDCGCERISPLWGIEIFHTSDPKKIESADGSFFWTISGSGRSSVTHLTVENVEGGRASTDDFVKGLSGAELDLKVKKAARANLDGNIARSLAGINSVPVEELRAAWAGTSKKVEQCRRGRGYGKDAAPRGAAPTVDPPACKACGAEMKYKADGKDGPVYFCPDWKKHKDEYTAIPADEWIGKTRKAAEGAA